jgi:hypothetical protein
MTAASPGDKTRTFIAPDELWLPFLKLVPQVEQSNGSVRLRKFIADYLDEYRVFWAPEAKEIDPHEKPVAWYECDECDMPHRLLPDPHDPRTHAPWGCSVLKARQDRQEKLKESVK